MLSRRAARKHLVASRLPKYFLRLRNAGSVSPGSGRPVRRELGYGPAVRLKPFRPHLTVGALSCAFVSMDHHFVPSLLLRPARHYPRLWLRTPLGVGPTGLPPARNARRPARTTRRSAPVPRITTLPLADLPLGVLAPGHRPRAQTAPLAGRPIGATGSRVPHQSPDHARATIHAGHPPGQSAGSRQAAPGAMTRPRFWMSSIRFRHFIGGSLALAFVIHT